MLTTFSPVYGKARVVAKGVLRPKSRLAGHLEVFSRSALLLARSRGLDIVTQAQCVQSFPEIREDLRRSSRALYGMELLDRMWEGGESGETQGDAETPEDGTARGRREAYRVYEVLLGFLGWVAEGDPDLALRYFESRLLALSGYGPELYDCLSCRQALQPATNGFSASAGGSLCPDCSGRAAGVRPISVNALKVMRLFQTGPLESARRVRVDAGLSRELEQLLRAYIPLVLDRELRSAGFLDSVRVPAGTR